MIIDLFVVSLLVGTDALVEKEITKHKKVVINKIFNNLITLMRLSPFIVPNPTFLGKVAEFRHLAWVKHAESARNFIVFG